MNAHPTTEQIARYRDRSAGPDELLRIDAHLATCDRCHSTLSSESGADVVVSLPSRDAGESDHLSYDEMERWIDGRAGAVEREIFEEHAANCHLCRDERADLDRVRETLVPTQTRFGWRMPLAAAATIVVAIGIGWFFRRDVVSTSPSKISVPPRTVQQAIVLTKPAILSDLLGGKVTLRGGESTQHRFTLLKPVATLVGEQRPEFRWTTVSGASSYTVTIVDADTGAAVTSGSTKDSSWRPGTALAQGKTYSWQVSAHVRGRRITEPRPPAPEARFEVASGETLNRLAGKSHNDPISRGVALAEEGFLDDAEEQLQVASDAGNSEARELLRQVRAWRRDMLP